jgi:hypothetical protein
MDYQMSLIEWSQLDHEPNAADTIPTLTDTALNLDMTPKLADKTPKLADKIPKLEDTTPKLTTTAPVPLSASNPFTLQKMPYAPPRSRRAKVRTSQTQKTEAYRLRQRQKREQNYAKLIALREDNVKLRQKEKVLKAQLALFQRDTNTVLTN